MKALRKTANLFICVKIQILFSKKKFLLFYDSFGTLVDERNELLEACEDLQCFFLQLSSRVISSFFSFSKFFYFLKPGTFIISIDNIKNFYNFQSRFQNFFLVGVLYGKTFINLHAFYIQQYNLFFFFEPDYLYMVIVQKKFLYFLFLLKICILLLVNNGINTFLNCHDNCKNV